MQFWTYLPCFMKTMKDYSALQQLQQTYSRYYSKGQLNAQKPLYIIYWFRWVYITIKAWLYRMIHFKTKIASMLHEFQLQLLLKMRKLHVSGTLPNHRLLALACVESDRSEESIFTFCIAHHF